MKRLLFASAAVACFLAGPAPASADSIAVRKVADPEFVKMTRATTALLVDAARRTYPGERCAGRTSWVFNATDADMAGSPGDGVAFTDECRIAIVPMDEFADVCNLAAHELGHLRGLEHTDDPRDLMYGGSWGEGVAPACVRAERIHDRARRRAAAPTPGTKGGRS
jgi:hypothetical protein